MEKEEKKKRSFLSRRWYLIPVALVLILVIAFFSYVSIYYRAEDRAKEALASSESVQVTEHAFGWLFDGPSETDALIFYPGGKVEESAYAPLAHALAKAGIDVFLLKMPFRLAVFDSDAAGDVTAAYSYERFFVGGHSLGGAMAANYAAKHGEELAGVILFAAYPTEKLPDHLTEILLVGSEDGVVRRDKIEAGQTFAPSKYFYWEIRGGNHAGFGCYGEQSGDGKATIDSAEQVAESVRVIMEHLV